MNNKYKKELVRLVTLIILSIIVFNININHAKAIETKAETAIVVDVDTGNILYAKEANHALPPASMTKMMTQYLVLEHITNGDISWDSMTEISNYAYWISGENDFSGVGLTQNKEYSVKKLYEAMIINSDNGTSVALAELIAGSEDNFVQMMNDKAKEFGLENTQFVNATGIDNELLKGKQPKSTKKNATNLMSAHDAAKLGYQIVKDYPEALDTSSMVDATFEGVQIRNSNLMLKHKEPSLEPYYYKGVRGLKTGYTDLAEYAFTAMAEKEGKQLIVVVMKAESKDERFKETAKLLDYGFDRIVKTELFSANFQREQESTIPVENGKEKVVDIATKDALTIPIEKGTEEDYKLIYQVDKKLLNENGELTAPIKKGEKVGQAEIVSNVGKHLGSILNEKENFTVDLVTTDEVEVKVENKIWFKIIVKSIKKLFVNLFNL